MALGQTSQASAVDLVDQVVRTASDSVAVRAPDGDLTYGQLARRAEDVARRLRRLGVGPGDLVGQCVNRSAALVVGALAAFRAGAAYVAIDPAYPDERVRWMLADARVSAIVADTANGRSRPLGRPAGRGARRRRPADPRRARRRGAGLGAAGRDAAVPASRPVRPRLCRLHLRLDRSSQGRDGRARRPGQPHRLASRRLRAHRRATTAPRSPAPASTPRCGRCGRRLAAGATLHVVPEELRRDPLGLRDWMIDAGDHRQLRADRRGRGARRPALAARTRRCAGC